MPGSPAIGAGTSSGITTDQRGFPLDSPIDIGAFQVQAGPLVVNTTADGSGSPPGKLDLRGAVDLADVLPGDQTITFDPTVFGTAQTITLTVGQLELSDTTGTETITGPAAGVTVSGGGASRVFQVDPNVTASISGMTITGGSTAGNGGGLYNYGGDLTLTDCTISGNSAGDSGGGLDTTAAAGDLASYVNAVTADPTNTFLATNISPIHADQLQRQRQLRSRRPYGPGGVESAGTTTLTNCTVSGNSAGNDGGGLYNYGGTITLTNCTVSGNSADYQRRRPGQLRRYGHADRLHHQRQLPPTAVTAAAAADAQHRLGHDDV